MARRVEANLMSTANPATSTDWSGGPAFERPAIHDTRSFSTHPKDRPRITPGRLARLEVVEAEMAEKLRQVLDRQGISVAILSRAGSNLARERFLGEVPRYTHCAFAHRQAGKWEVLHVINTHAGSLGDLRRQPLVDFVRDDPWKYRFEVMTVNERVESVLAEALSTLLPRQVFRRPYSAIAHPRSNRYQQSNQWLAEFLGSCLLGRGDEKRSGVQALLHDHGLRPSVIRKRILAGFVGQWAYQAVSKNLRFDDHPPSQRVVGDFAFISSTTVRDLLQENDWIRDHHEVHLGVSLGGSCSDEELIGSQDL